MACKRSFTGYIVLLAILSAVCVASQTVVVIALFLIIPGLMLLAAPSLLAYSLVFAAGLIMPGWWRWPSAILLTAAVGVIPPWLANRPLVTRAAALRAGDIAYQTRGARPGSIALLIARPAWRANRDLGQLDCNQYCLRLLYGKAATTILVGVPGTAGNPLRNVTLAAYRIVMRDRCPAAAVPESDGWRQLGDDIGGDKAVDTIRLRIAAGECLVREPGNLHDAELVIVEQPLDVARPQGDPRPLLQARRVAAWRRTDQGFTPIFRQTMTDTRPLIVPWIYSRDGEWLKDLQFLRTTRHEAAYTLPDVMRHTFGYALTVAPAPQSSRWPLRDALRRGLDDRHAASNDPSLVLTEQYLRAVAESGPADGDDVKTIASIVADRRIDAARLFYLGRAIRRLGESGAALGGPLLDRLNAAPVPAGADIVQTMARGIQSLPPGAARALYPRLLSLSQDGSRRDKAWAALTRLADAGPSALDRILTVADIPAGTAGVRGEAPMGGLIALCTLGRDGAAAAPRLAAEITATPAAARHGSRYELLWIILERQGYARPLLAALHPDAAAAQEIERWRRTARDPHRACSSTWV